MKNVVRDHTSVQAGLLWTSPQEGPRVLWTVPMGPASWGAAVRGQKELKAK